MTTHLRRTFVATVLVLSFVGLGVLEGDARQGAAGQGASAGQTAATPAPTPAVRPEQKALTDAMALTDMAARVTALEKIRTDFPEASNMAQVDQQLMINLVNNFPDRLDAISATFERIVGRISPDATIDARVNGLIGPIGTLTGKKLLLDRSTALLTDVAAKLDPEKYAEMMKEAAARASRPAPPQATIDTTFNSLKARTSELLGRVYLAKGDQAKAEAEFKNAIKAQPTNAAATRALVDLYTAKSDWASAESTLKQVIDAQPTAALKAGPQQLLADVYIKKGDDKNAEELLSDILKNNATSTAALLPLARLEAKRGADDKALEHFMTAALNAQLKPADHKMLETLYAKKNGGKAAGLEAALDKAYHDKFPNPVEPEAYKPTTGRTNKLVLLELFTGSGCPPCVASDLALESVMERYGNHIISIAYHAHIPRPDPMVAANANERRTYYAVGGVPTFEIDGAMVANAAGSNPGGGARTNTGNVYNNYKASIDKALEAPARAALDVKATGEGDTVSVTVNVTQLPSDAKDLKLHIVLVEKELKFAGENGIRFHPMAVRATAGDKGAGLPITATGTSKYTFSLNQIRDDITKSLAADIERRRKTEAPGSTPVDYAAEGNAYTAINTSELMVVAFIQEGAYRAPKPGAAPAPQLAPQPVAAGSSSSVQSAAAAARPTPQPGTPTASADVALMNILNAAKTDVVFSNASRTKGGGW